MSLGSGWVMPFSDSVRFVMVPVRPDTEMFDGYRLLGLGVDGNVASVMVMGVVFENVVAADAEEVRKAAVNVDASIASTATSPTLRRIGRIRPFRTELLTAAPSLH
jgi:hypothetical protein